MIVHTKRCVFCQASLYVHLTMLQPSNGQPPLLSAVRSQKRHNAKLIDGRKRQAIIIALANGESKRSIARRLNASQHTVAIISDQEWQQVAARKARIAAQAERMATAAADRLNTKLESQEDLSPQQLVPIFGVAVDKLTVLRGDPSLTIRHDVVLHRERQEMRTLLDLIKTFNLDPAAITLEHHTNSPMQNAGIAVLNAINAKAAKRAQATVVEVPALPAKTGHHSEKTPQQKAGLLNT